MQPNYYLGFIFLMMLNMVSSTCIAQLDSVTYDCNSMKFDKPFPFDVPFRIKFVKVPSAATDVEIQIKDITSTRKIVKDLRKNGKIVSNEAIFTHKWAPTPFFQNTTEMNNQMAIIDVVPKLDPNKIYYVKVNLSQPRALNSAEKPIVDASLITAPFWNDLLGDLAKQEILRGGFSVDASFVTQIRDKLLAETNAYLFSSLPDYRLINLDLATVKSQFNSSVLLNLGLINTAYRDIQNAIDQLNTSKTNPLIQEVKLDKILPPNKIGELKSASDPVLTEILKEYSRLVGNTSMTAINITTLRTLITDSFNDIVTAKTNIISTLVTNILVSSIIYHGSFAVTFPNSPTERAKNLVYADAGYGHTFPKEEVTTPFAFTAMDVYFRPINTTIPLFHYNESFGLFLLSRVSVLVGANLGGDVDKTNFRQGYLGSNKTVLLGAGARLNENLKFNLGYMFYKKYPSPLVKEADIGASSFFSLSFNFDISKIFKSGN